MRGGPLAKHMKKTSLCSWEKPGITAVHNVWWQGVGTGTLLFAFLSSCCCCIEIWELLRITQHFPVARFGARLTQRAHVGVRVPNSVSFPVAIRHSHYSRKSSFAAVSWRSSKVNCWWSSVQLCLKLIMGLVKAPVSFGHGSESLSCGTGRTESRSQCSAE